MGVYLWEGKKKQERKKGTILKMFQGPLWKPDICCIVDIENGIMMEQRKIILD